EDEEVGKDEVDKRFDELLNSDDDDNDEEETLNSMRSMME
ncbi:unnamed protein product, partial [Rotaria socialis]